MIKGSLGLFARAHRLLRDDGYDHVVQSEYIANRYLKVFFVQSDKHNARLGIISSKKMQPKAVDRNRIKRVIREVFRKHSIKLHNVDVVVMVKAPFTTNIDNQCECLERLLLKVENQCAES